METKEVPSGEVMDSSDEVLPASSLATVVLLGKLGSGKTSLFNKVTGSNHLVGSGAQSATLTAAGAKAINHDMYVIDTPGEDPVKDVLAHVAEQIGALESVPVNQIAIVADIARIGPLVLKIRPILNLFGNTIASIIVTKSELLLFTDEDKKELAEHLELDVSRIFFCEINTPSSEIIAFLAQNMRSARALKLTDDQVSGMLFIASQKEQIDKELRDITNKFAAAVRFVDNITPCRDNDNCILDLSIFLQNEHDRVKKKLWGDAATANEHLGVLLGNIILRLNMALLQTVEKLNKRLSYWQLALGSKSAYRRCPWGGCGLIWTKVSGCNGLTTCGARPLDKPMDASDSGCYWQYIFEFVLGEIGTDTWVLHAIPNGKGLLKLSWESLPEVKAVGCGRTIEWDRMIPIQEKELNELLKVSLPASHNSIDTAAAGALAKLSNHATRAKRALRGSMKWSTAQKQTN
jgi:hypothetical protein